MQSGDPLSYLDTLNPAQREAVETTDGPVLVLAGAGTGKTKVLTTRLGYIMATHRADHWQIFAVTFTNKAAQEMKNRVSWILGGRPVEGMWIGTFHSLAARMLRAHAGLVGLKPNFTILDEDDQIRLLKQLLEAENIDPKKWAPKMLLGIIQKWKDRAELPGQQRASDAGEAADGKLPKLYAQYQERLRTLNACDFGDLLMHMITIFRDPANTDVLARYQNQFKYLLVDEYQDTNTSQYLWLRLLAQKHKNICCVGDDDQSIYGWRGAEIGNILKFEQDFPGAKIIRLEQNYRSTQHILSAANGVIGHNKGRLGKNLWSAAGDGEKVRLRGVWDAQTEAQSVAEEIEDLQRKKTSLNEMAVLVRAAHQMRTFEDVFLKLSIPYRVIGGPRFFERQEIRDAMAYIRVIVQPDDDLAFQRIINVPKRGIGDATLNMLSGFARTKGMSMTAALRLLLDTDEFKPKVRDTLRILMRDFDRWREQLRTIPHPELAQIVLDESGYTGMWQADKSPEAAGRLENLKELVSAITEYDNFDLFLEHVALVMENQQAEDVEKVTIMTLHAAKGLEFDAVFLPGWEEGLFPSQRSMDENGVTGLEEERRLAYVGITRAKKLSYIYFAANRVTYGNWQSCLPSRFLDELPKDHVDVKSDSGLYRPQAQTSSSSYGAGWHRQSRAELVDNSIDRISPSLASEGGFSAGDRVFHQKFGYGTVVMTEGDKLDIKFDKAGRKKVIDSFVSKEGEENP
jgi:DNA helicase-2/ATP-dependent DNA helicase PcrA